MANATDMLEAIYNVEQDSASGAQVEDEPLNDSGIIEDYQDMAVEEPEKKTFKKRKIIGPLTRKEMARREAQNRSQRRTRRRRTAMKNIMSLEDPKTANCAVFCLITNLDTGRSSYCGSTRYVNKFIKDEPICYYSDCNFTNESSLTNINNFGIPSNLQVDDIEGRVEASPEKTTLRTHQRQMLQGMAMSQGSSSTMSGPTGLSTCSTLKKKMEFISNFGCLKNLFKTCYADDEVKGVVFKTTIKGYHHFHIRPLVGKDFIMDICPEPTNKYDHNALLVKAPALESIPAELHNKITKDSKPTQRVKDVAGRDIGRVPGEIARVLAEGIRKGYITKGVMMHTGGFTHGGQGRGGGPQLNALCMVVIRNKDVKQVTKGLMRGGVEVFEIKL